MGPLLHDGEERGVAERAVTKLRSSLAAAGGGLRGAAAKLPADQAIALFDFAGEEVRRSGVNSHSHSACLLLVHVAQA